MTFMIEDLRSAFAVPGDVAYFNTASLSPALHSVLDAGAAALERRARPWTITAPDWFDEVEELRSRLAVLFGDAGEPGDPGAGVALVPATSYGFATAARNLPLRAGEVVVVLAEEYPSGIYTWRRSAARSGARIVTVTREPGQDWADAVEAVLDATRERTAVVSVPQVHWTDGAWVDLDRVAARTHALQAALVVDASQSLGAVPFDATALRPDFVVAVGYKWLLGPFGRGYLWVAPQHRAGEPLEENWIARAGSEDFARLVDYRDEYQPGARRFDQGQRTMFELTPMAVAAVGQVLDWGVHAIAAHVGAITSSIVDRVRDLGLDPPVGRHGPHMVGLPLPERTRHTVVEALAECGVHAAVRGKVLRVAPHRHITDADVDRLVDALAAALA
jgi:selenocysteine lyase/cysteine desulfurase